MTASKPDASPKSIAESLIEKLEARVSHAVNPSMLTLERNQAFVEAITIIRQHHAKQQGDVVERVAKIIDAKLAFHIRRGIHDTDYIPSLDWKKVYLDVAKATIAAMGDGSATIAPVSAETVVQPITPASSLVEALLGLKYSHGCWCDPAPKGGELHSRACANAQRALNATGDASNRKDENAKQPGDITSPARCEISSADKMEDAAYRPKGWDNSVVDLGTALAILADATKPVSVSLEKGAIACSQWVYGSNHGKTSWDRLSEEHRNEYREQAKACARAWGMTYGD